MPWRLAVSVITFEDGKGQDSLYWLNLLPFQVDEPFHPEPFPFLESNFPLLLLLLFSQQEQINESSFNNHELAAIQQQEFIVVTDHAFRWCISGV